MVGQSATIFDIVVSIPIVERQSISIPPKRDTLLSGTSKYVSKGKKNYFYTYRIKATVDLF